KHARRAARNHPAMALIKCATAQLAPGRHVHGLQVLSSDALASWAPELTADTGSAMLRPHVDHVDFDLAQARLSRFTATDETDDAALQLRHEVCAVFALAGGQTTRPVCPSGFPIGLGPRLCQRCICLLGRIDVDAHDRIDI